MDLQIEPVNCEACGDEVSSSSELNVVHLVNWPKPLHICNKCKKSSSEESFETAASLLKKVASLAESDEDPEIRLARIKMLFL